MSTPTCTAKKMSCKMSQGTFSGPEGHSHLFGKFPSIPHLPFSPSELETEDWNIDERTAEGFLVEEVVVTEKLDGGCCSVFSGEVYARSTSHPANHASFGPVKALISSRRSRFPAAFAKLDAAQVVLVGENMFGVHSIKYRSLVSPFYLFAVAMLSGADGGEGLLWLSWEDVEAVAKALCFPTAPRLYRGVFTSLSEIQLWMDSRAAKSSAVSVSNGQPEGSQMEGFVLRTAASFAASEFSRRVAKYVRKMHVQTTADWPRTWEKANVVEAPVPPPGCCVQPRGLYALPAIIRNFQAVSTLLPSGTALSLKRPEGLSTNTLTTTRRLGNDYGTGKTASAGYFPTGSLTKQENSDESTCDSHTFVKFPRTLHLFDTGGYAVSRDDLVLDIGEASNLFFSGDDIVVQEKLDGANLGIWLDGKCQVMCQNRAHLISSKSAGQFKSLGVWIERHRRELCNILQPRRHVLFGEWLYARHSVEYTKLPGYFLAVDLYDRHAGRFVSSRVLQEVLHGTTIPRVPTIHTGSLAGINDVRALLETHSRFGEGFVEGVYLRKESVDWLLARSKSVRPDFLRSIYEGNHWSRGPLVKNGVQYISYQG
ncbi:unnamed protein product [Discosporangium mesarthrocarpum]